MLTFGAVLAMVMALGAAQTPSETYAGPTPTGFAPFLAQTNTVNFGPSMTFLANMPLETAETILGNAQSQNIFHLMGNMCPYFSNPMGFGVQEYPLPPGANITQVQMLSRHGSRYPTVGSNIQTFGGKIKNNTGKFNATGALSFLNTWKYELGAEILVPSGREEQFSNGVLHYYNYGRLYNTSTKIIARTTSQDRMLKSAEYFLAGFFGLDWARNATLEVIVESLGFNNSLAAFYSCNNSLAGVSAGGSNASSLWIGTYLQNATHRLQSMVTGLNWTVTDTYAAQTMCVYETISLGYSSYCSLFTYQEYEDFAYVWDVIFYGSYSFGSPTGRASGIAWQQEAIARLQHQTLGYSNSDINTTLDSNPATFPTNQSLYFDFTHDADIVSVLTAFGFTQFAEFLPVTNITRPPKRNFTSSSIVPFAARLDIELINAPAPLAANRSYLHSSTAKATQYVHFILNQRTLPLGFSFPACGADRLDGWCELQTFLEAQKNATELAEFEYACFGKYPPVPYGTIKNGAPI